MMTLTPRKPGARTGQEVNAHWTRSETWTWQGKPVVKGSRVRISGRRGQFTFVEHVIAPPRPGSGKRTVKEWVTVLSDHGYVSVLPDKITADLPPVKTKARKK